MALRLITAPDCAGSGAALDAVERADHRSYLLDFLRVGPAGLVTSTDLERLVLVVGRKAVPVVVNDGSEENCYLLSPYAHYVKYMLLELRKISGVQARVLQGMVGLLGRACLPLGFNRCVSVNNWLMTTNPALQLTAAELTEVTDALTSRYPKLPIVLRTIDAREPDVRRMFAATGYKLVVNRPVHEWNPARLKRAHRREVQHDIRLLSDPRFAISAPAVLGPGDEETLHRLYSAIYVNKHQGYNARYTARFFRCMYESGMMRFLTIRHQDRIVAFLTTFDEGAHIVGALLGYDTSLDKKQFPLYRMALAAVLRDGLEHRRLVFLSTGAASFKQNRGTYEWMEHEAIYDRHLSAHRRVPWAVFKALLDAGTKGLATEQI